ncbi:MAG: hypothetical protein U9R43_17990 [Thermodesulfobacteriota bacterium]|nr:hypothetical protein [Thermodesulfobacteriota bacterium]
MKLSNVTIITIISAIIIIGCSGYGKLVIESKNEAGVTIDELIEKSDDYDIHHFGHGEKFVSGIIFDPKKDNKKILPGDRWMRIDEQTTISDIVKRIKGSDFPRFVPTLYKIVGPDGVFYGYLFTGWSHIVLKKIDDDTLSVYGLDDPPEYLDIRGVILFDKNLGLAKK